MPSNIITAGDATNGLIYTGGNDNTLTLQTGPSGAKVNAVTNNHYTALDWANTGNAPSSLKRSITRLLRKHGAKTWGELKKAYPEIQSHFDWPPPDIP